MADDIEFKALLDTGDFDAGMAVLTGGLLHIGSLAVDAFLAAGKAVGQFASESFQGATDAESAMARVGSVIKSTGGAAGLTAQDVQDLGSQFATLAGGTDDTVIAIEEMGLRMGNISKEQMPNFIQTTLDLAAATGVDAVAGARLMAQAYDDPASAMSKLSKQGILFDTELENQVKGLVESGDKAGAYALVMERVGEATSGAAAAGLETVAGKMELFKNTIKEAGEAVMGAFLPVLSTLFDTFIGPNLPLITKMAERFGNLFSAILSGGDPSAALMGISMAIGKAFGPDVASMVMNVIGFFMNDLPAAFQAGLVAIQPIIDAAANLGAVFLSSMPMIQASVAGMIAFVQEQFAIFGPPIIANVAAVLDTISAFWSAHGAEVMAIISFAFGLVVTVIGGAITLISGLVSAGLTYLSGVWSFWSALLQGDTEGAFNAIKLAVSQAMLAVLSTIGSVLEGAANLVGTNLETIRSDWSGNLSNLVTITTTIFNQVVDAIKDAVGKAVSLGVNFVQGIIDGIKSMAGAIAAAAAGVALDALAAAQDALGISSPSKVAAAQIGAPYVQGIMQGIEGQMGQLNSITDNLIQSLANPMQSATSNSYSDNSQRSVNYNLALNTQETSQSVIGNFAVMQSLAGA